MAKKILITGIAMIVLSLCCGMCFAEDGSNKINLGNEIMKSIDKTESSSRNLVSGNVVKDTGNAIKDGERKIENGITDIDGVGYYDNDNNGMQDKNYETTRTTTEGTTNNGMNTMTTTTWMWIILVVAAVIIIAAIWYYATQGNS